MVPFVQVPTNFGRNHIGSLTHSNLVLNLKNGKKSRANSLILSFNSPVIEGLVASLQLTSMDMQDFEETSVDCFIDCMYTGDIEKMNNQIFREVHKMAKVFNVSWLMDRCSDYFKILVEEVAMNSYEELLFLFDEGSYAFISLKTHSHFDCIVKKMGSVTKTKEFFINKYMADFNTLSISQIDLVLELAGSDVGIVIQSLTGQLAKHMSLHGAIFTATSRHLLNSADLLLCQRNNKMAYENFFDTVQGIDEISAADLKWALSLYRNPRNAFCKNCSVSKEVIDHPTPSTKISNLFHSFHKFEDISNLNTLVDRLVDDPEVKNIVMFTEAIWCWITENKNVETVIFNSSEWISKIVRSIKRKRGWNAVPKSCFLFWEMSSSSFRFSAAYNKNFFTQWMQCEDLFERSNQEMTHVITSLNSKMVPDTMLADKLISKKSKLIFYLPKDFDDQLTNCKIKGKCGFVLETNPPCEKDPFLFDIKLCTDPSEYPAGIHFHENIVQAENMHFMMEYWNAGKETWRYVPLSWCDKPVVDNSNFNSRFKWGHFMLVEDMKCLRAKVLLFK